MTQTFSDYPPEAPRECNLCPRLVEYRSQNKMEHPDWFNGAVPSFGDENASLLIVGLAPGVTGANKTSRPFTGDYAGDLLYETIDKFDLSVGTYRASPNDGLELKNTMITNAVRCVPPQNKPIGSEINECRPFLVSRVKSLENLKVIIALGKIAHDSVVRTFGGKLNAHKFAHAAEHNIDGPNGKIILLDSYHCSRYNTNTGRLTAEMFETVFRQAKAYL